MNRGIKNVNKYSEEITEIFNSIMALTIRNCRNSDPQISAEAREINTEAYKGSKLIEKLLSEYKREKLG